MENKHYGHIGCCSDAEYPYVVPVTYVYKDNAIYCYSYVGEKIQIMRNQPRVCFQVEDLISNTSWQSAMLWGSYKELQGIEREEGFSLLLEKFWKEYNRQTSIYFPFRNPEATLNENDIIIFTIQISEQKGRFEEYES